MAFGNYPNVDESSKRSEESVIEVKRIFQRKNGFISREEIPDYGVDLEVELIIDGEHASGKKFPIQIKSTQKLNIVEKEGRNHISLEFETSRLGYLYRHQPSHGLIVIYDEKNKQLYYDFVEEIIYRIIDQRGSDEWKQQNKVNINIPINNLLNTKNASAIHQKMVYRFENLELLIEKHGEQFEIPSFTAHNKSEFFEQDLKNPDIIIRFLNEHGIFLLNNNYFNQLFKLISKLTIAEITESPKLMILAALTYYRIGMYIESYYYLKKCSLFLHNFSKDEADILKMTKLHTEFVLGNLNREAFLKNLHELKEEVENVLYKIEIGVLLVFIELLTIRRKKEIVFLFKEISTLLDQLENQNKIELEDRKMISLQLYFYLFQVGEKLLITKMTELKIKKGNPYIPNDEESINWIEEITSIQEKATKNARKVYLQSKEWKNKHLEARSLFMLSNYFFSKEFINTKFGSYIPTNNISDKFRENLNYALEAFRIFSDLNMIQGIYLSLSIAYEIHRLYEYLFNKQLDDRINGTTLKKQLSELQKKIGIEPEKSIVDNYIENSVQETDFSIDEGFVGLNEEDIDDFANTLLDTYGLPDDRLPNIKTGIISLKKFFENRFCDNLELRENLSHTEMKATMYSSKPRFIIICQKCNQKTKEGEDVNSLLDSLDKKKCYCLTSQSSSKTTH